VGNKELYDLADDPGENQNVIAKHPGVVAELRDAYDKWWAEARKHLVNEAGP